MDDLLTRAWDMLIGRTAGPLKFRLILQPTVAAVLAVRAGIQDAREGRAPYLWLLVRSGGDRGRLLHEGWSQVRAIFLVAVLLDVVYQIIVFRWVYIVQALFVATMLAVLPYLLMRALAGRLGLLSRRR